MEGAGVWKDSSVAPGTVASTELELAVGLAALEALPSPRPPPDGAGEGTGVRTAAELGDEEGAPVLEGIPALPGAGVDKLLLVLVPADVREAVGELVCSPPP